MTADLPARDAASAVAAVLAVGPLYGANDWLIELTEPDAGRIAAAVLRWLAENAPVHDYGEFIEREWSAPELRELADEIDGGTDERRT